MPQTIRKKCMNNLTHVDVRLNNANSNYNNATGTNGSVGISSSGVSTSSNYQPANQKQMKINENNPIHYNHYNNPMIKNHLHNHQAVMNNNIDRLRLQEMASYWPYGQFVSPIRAPPGYGLLSPRGAAAMPFPMPGFPPSTAIPPPKIAYENCQLRNNPPGNNIARNKTGREVKTCNLLLDIGIQVTPDSSNNQTEANLLTEPTPEPVPNISGNPDQEGSLVSSPPNHITSELSSSPTTSITSLSDRDVDKKNSSRFNLDMTEVSTESLVNPNSITPISLGDKEDSTITLSQKQFIELTRLAMRGSETAERLAYTHRNRPCFKKIDSLCARMKQDLIRPDGVLPNINSQGIAWAVKDFIFVFTRVINAWIIIKGYVYNTPEGLNKVKAALSDDFIRSFAAWQDTTMDFVENLIKSFVNLDQLVQTQKTPFQKMESMMKAPSSTPVKNYQNLDASSIFDESFDYLSISSDNNCNKAKTSAVETENISVTSADIVDIEMNTSTVATCSSGQTTSTPSKSYYSTLVEDSEESQRKATVNGTYFKTGVYNPILKDSISVLDPIYFTADMDSVEPSPETLSEPEVSPEKSNKKNSIDILNEIKWPSVAAVYSEITPTDDENTVLSYYQPPTIPHEEGDGKIFAESLSLENLQKTSTNCLPYHLKILETNITKFSDTFDPSVTRPIGPEMVKKLETLLEEIRNLSEGNMFFSERFMKNYFPDFAAHYPKFLDLRSIFLKAQTGGYGDINEIVHDLKLIIYYARIYLKTNHNDLLKNSIEKYESEIDKILKDEIFNNMHFDYITGDPNEILPRAKIEN